MVWGFWEVVWEIYTGEEIEGIQCSSLMVPIGVHSSVLRGLLASLR